ncbi:MAG: tRNA pseudouridine(55) synthase TruB [Gammaproteobacteria bacterium]|nr:tRNA pseudouridine(55) synthase TruB [Gammaproteobacteria bacterium]
MGRRLRSSGRVIDGVIVLDKPLGWTSNHAVQRVKRLFNARKVGHTGTLDQRATGVLPLCFGEATKFSQHSLNANKTYEVGVQLGIATDTGDTDGTVTTRKPVPELECSHIEGVLESFRGEINQIPSMYSAIKRDGQPLYKLARQGIEVERAARRITIYRNELKQFDGTSFELIVECTKGTYIRTLVADIGNTIGCGAHVSKLDRLQVGHFSKQDCVTFKCLTDAKNNGQIDEFLRPVSSMVEGWLDIKLPRPTAYLVRQGQAVPVPPCSPTRGWVKLLEERADGEFDFLGIGEIESGHVAPRRLVASNHSPSH